MGRELTSAVLVFFGAGLGGVLRHLVNRAVPIAVSAQFPLSTFLVNAIGCFAMGALAGWFAFRGEASTQPLRLFLATGVLGGFTTFSAFSLDAAVLWQRGAGAVALAYVAGSVGAALIGVVAGLALMRALLG
jgi:CrcB protein